MPNSSYRLHTPVPDPEEDEEEPRVKQPPVPPNEDSEVIPQREPPQPGDDGPRSWVMQFAVVNDDFGKGQHSACEYTFTETSVSRRSNTMSNDTGRDAALSASNSQGTPVIS